MISRRRFLLSSVASGAGYAAAPKLFAATQTAANIESHGYHYIRLFPPGAASTPGSDLEKGLIELAGKMKDNEDAKGDSDIFAGYTYLGQFIDHDLTLDITPLDEVRPQKVEQTRNYRTPFLDLDQLYGSGPDVSSFLYRKHGSESPQGEERFLLGATTESTVVNSAGHTETLISSCNDLPRNSQGTALVGDARQDENLILAQLHIAFLKLHNFVLNHPAELGKSPYYKIEPAFEAARRVVTWHYQWIVRHDFLRSILDPDLLNQLDSRDYKSLIRGPLKGFQIPIEFSAAAFRFGHSMVRHEYPYNSRHEGAKLVDDLFQRTGFGKTGNVPLPEEWVIGWERFFRLRSPFSVAMARKIDTRITEDLFHLLPPQLRAFSAASNPKTAFAPDPPELPVRTLLRGARMGLPVAQGVARKILLLDPKIRVLSADEIAKGPHQAFLRQQGFDKDTPLWYYILKEAEVIHSGKRLGPIGSRIVADVILASLAADPKSYINVAGRDWVPTLWRPTPEDETPTGMAELLGLVTSARAEDSKACNNT
jgi:hypothetical protein